VNTENNSMQYFLTKYWCLVAMQRSKLKKKNHAMPAEKNERDGIYSPVGYWLLSRGILLPTPTSAPSPCLHMSVYWSRQWPVKHPAWGMRSWKGWRDDQQLLAWRSPVQRNSRLHQFYLLNFKQNTIATKAKIYAHCHRDHNHSQCLINVWSCDRGHNKVTILDDKCTPKITHCPSCCKSSCTKRKMYSPRVLSIMHLHAQTNIKKGHGPWSNIHNLHNKSCSGKNASL